MPTTTVVTLQFLSQRLKLRSLSQRWVVNESLCDNVEAWPIATMDESVTENKQALRSTLGTLGDREVFAEVQYARTNLSPSINVPSTTIPRELGTLI